MTWQDIEKDTTVIELKKLDPSIENFTSFPRKFENLDSIHISNSNIKSFLGFPKKLHNIKDLNVAGNFETFEGLPDLMPQLESLSLSSYIIIKNLTGLPKRIPRLSDLDLANLKFESFTGIALSLDNIKKLWCHNYFGDDLSGFPQNMERVNEIIIAETKYLHEDFNEIGFEKGLRSLKSMPYTLPNLVFLYLNDNQIQNLEGISQSLPELDLLRLENNHIQNIVDFPKEIFKLRRLWLQNNKIESLIGLPNKLPMLEDINLNENNLNSLKGLPSELPNLKYLSLASNNLESCEFLPSTLPKLIDIQLSSNKLKTLIGLPKHLPQLVEMFNISKNLLENFEGMPQLPENTEIWLSDNPFRSLFGLDQRMIAIILEVINPKKYSFSTQGLKFIEEGNIESIYNYYKKSPLEMAQNLINGMELPEEEWVRLVHEARSLEYDLLKKHLQLSHPIIQAITKRFNETSFL
jgi:Leucine-rich repeat (LRR) protein